MLHETLKNDLKVLAEAQHAFEFNQWKNVGSVQRDTTCTNNNWGTIYQKDDRQFYLNIQSANKALQFLQRAV